MLETWLKCSFSACSIELNPQNLSGWAWLRPALRSPQRAKLGPTWAQVALSGAQREPKSEPSGNVGPMLVMFTVLQPGACGISFARSVAQWGHSTGNPAAKTRAIPKRALLGLRKPSVLKRGFQPGLKQLQNWCKLGPTWSYVGPGRASFANVDHRRSRCCGVVGSKRWFRRCCADMQNSPVHLLAPCSDRSAPLPQTKAVPIEWVAHPNRPAALLTYHAPALSVQVDLQQTIPECWSWFLMFLPGIFNI